MPLPMNKAASGFTFLLGFTGFLLSILCLFAGSSPGFLPAGDMMSVNISQLGKTPLFGGADLSKCKRQFDINTLVDAGKDVVDTVTDVGECGVETIKDGVNKAQNFVADKLQEALNLPDFIDLHVMNFCTGKFDPEDYVAKGIVDPKKDRTFCSIKATEFSFSLTDIVEDKLPAGLTLESIKWPDEITKAEATLRTATRAMIYMYCIGVGTAGGTALVSIAGIFVAKGVIGMVTMGLSGISFFALMIASAASTAIVRKAVPKINEVGEKIGIAATQGNVFIGMTWAATLIMFVAIIAGVAQFFARKKMMGQGQGQDPYYGEKANFDQYPDQYQQQDYAQDYPQEQYAPEEYPQDYPPPTQPAERF